MTELKPVVTEHVLAAELPKHLRHGLDAAMRVRVTVEPEPDIPNPLPLRQLMGSAKGAYATPEEAVSFIRALRDEWGD